MKKKTDLTFIDSLDIDNDTKASVNESLKTAHDLYNMKMYSYSKDYYDRYLDTIDIKYINSPFGNIADLNLISKYMSVLLGILENINTFSSIFNNNVLEVKTDQELKLYSISEQITWGEFKGKKISDLLLTKEGAEYIIWCIINLPIFCVNEDIIFLEKYIRYSANLIMALKCNKFKKNYYFRLLDERNREEENRYSQPYSEENDPNRPEYYGYSSWSSMNYNEVDDGNMDLHDEFNF
jgi:hypothetical protein